MSKSTFKKIKRFATKEKRRIKNISKFIDTIPWYGHILSMLLSIILSALIINIYLAITETQDENQKAIYNATKGEYITVTVSAIILFILGYLMMRYNFHFILAFGMISTGLLNVSYLIRIYMSKTPANRIRNVIILSILLVVITLITIFIDNYYQKNQSEYLLSHCSLD
jgi:ABC-type Fe3+ transport system permease subunit